MLCEYLLRAEQPLPLGSLFNDTATFQKICEIIMEEVRHAFSETFAVDCTFRGEYGRV